MFSRMILNVMLFVFILHLVEQYKLFGEDTLNSMPHPLQVATLPIFGCLVSTGTKMTCFLSSLLSGMHFPLYSH